MSPPGPAAPQTPHPEATGPAHRSQLAGILAAVPDPIRMEVVMAAHPTPAQYLSALERANAVRLRRAEVKRDLFAGRVTVRDVLRVDDLHGVVTLEDVEPLLAGMTVGELVSAPRQWGPTRMRRLLAECAVGEHVPLGDLTSPRRRAIVARIDGQREVTEAEVARRREVAAARERQAVAQRARRAREVAEREEAERLRAEQRARAATADPLDVECPNCRSGVGQACSWYDPVGDHWREPRAPCRERRARAEALA